MISLCESWRSSDSRSSLLKICDLKSCLKLNIWQLFHVERYLYVITLQLRNLHKIHHQSDSNRLNITTFLDTETFSDSVIVVWILCGSMCSFCFITQTFCSIRSFLFLLWHLVSVKHSVLIFSSRNSTLQLWLKLPAPSSLLSGELRANREDLIIQQ